MNSKRFKLWDLPTRLFHWLLVICVSAAIGSGLIGGNLIVWHERFGLAIVGLVVFRLVWGLAGSTYARFAEFFPTPGKIKAYLNGEWRGHGHNPLGALSVFGLLSLLAFQVLSGLFSNDDIAFVGPLFDLVDKNLSNQLTGWHKLATNLLFGLTALHLAAIAFYGHVKKDNLVKPMITGWKEGAEGKPAKGGGVVALIIALLLAGSAVFAASGAWLPEPPPAPQEATPAW